MSRLWDTHDDGGEPKYYTSSKGDQRGERGVDQTHCGNEKQVDDNNTVFEISRLGHFSDVTRSVRKHESSNGYHGELDELDEFENDQKTAQPEVSTEFWRDSRQPGEPICTLRDVGVLNFFRLALPGLHYLRSGIFFSPSNTSLAEAPSPICSTTSVMALAKTLSNEKTIKFEMTMKK